MAAGYKVDEFQKLGILIDSEADTIANEVDDRYSIINTLPGAFAYLIVLKIPSANIHATPIQRGDVFPGSCAKARGAGIRSWKCHGTRPLHRRGAPKSSSETQSLSKHGGIEECLCFLETDLSIPDNDIVMNVAVYSDRVK